MATSQTRTRARTPAKPRKAPQRGQNGRFKPRAKAAKSGRTTALGVAAGLGALAAGAAAALRFGLFDRLRPVGNAEHPAPDLAADRPHPSFETRAADAFRPDPTAPVTAAERDGLRPAPTLPIGAGADTRSETLQ